MTVSIDDDQAGMANQCCNFFLKCRLGCVSFVGQGTLLISSQKRCLPRRIPLTSSPPQLPCSLRVWQQPKAQRNPWLCFAWTLLAACVSPVRCVFFLLTYFCPVSVLFLFVTQSSYHLTHLYFLLLLFGFPFHYTLIFHPSISLLLHIRFLVITASVELKRGERRLQAACQPTLTQTSGEGTRSTFLVNVGTQLGCPGWR